ncbi:hypothetical protein ACKVEX_03885 [Rhodocyclaceae bacterium SMB388]
MSYRELVHQRDAETLGIVRQAGMLALEAAEAFGRLSLETLHNRVTAHHQWSLALADGQPVDLQIPEHTHHYLHRSFHIFTEHYSQWMRLAEAQMQIAQRNAHETLERLQQWSPHGTEFAAQTLDVVVDATEHSAESLADASVAITQAMDARIAEAQPTRPRSTRRRISGT